GANGAGEGGAAHLVVVVDAIEGDVGLVAAATVQSAVPRVDRVVDVGADIGDPGLQAQDTRSVATLKGKSENLSRIECVADGGVRGVHRGPDGFGYRDGVGDRAQFHLDVHALGGIDEGLDFGGLGVAESGGSDTDQVVARLQGEKLIMTLLIGSGFTGDTACRVGSDNLGSVDRRAL